MLVNIGLIYATLGEHEAAVEQFIAATQLDQFLAVASVAVAPLIVDRNLTPAQILPMRRLQLPPHPLRRRLQRLLLRPPLPPRQPVHQL